MTFRPSKQPMHPEIMLPSLFLCHGGATEKKERKKRTKKWGGRKMKNQPCVRSVADSDKSFRTHRAGYFIGQGSIDTALARVVASIDTERGGDKIAEHTAWVLGRRRFFGMPLFCYVFFVKYHGVRLGPTFVEYAGNIRLYWRAHWGGRCFTTPFFGFLGKFIIAALYYSFAIFFPSSASYLRNNLAECRPKTDKAEHKAVTPCEPRAPYGHSRRKEIDQVDLQGHSQASMVGRRKRTATRELFSSSRQSHLTDIGKIYTKSPAFFLGVVGFVAPQVVSIYAREVQSPL